MKECFCSIFNTREERLVDEEGRVTFRLICNICGCILDSRAENENIVGKGKSESSEGQGDQALSV